MASYSPSSILHLFSIIASQYCHTALCIIINKLLSNSKARTFSFPTIFSDDPTGDRTLNLKDCKSSKDYLQQHQNAGFSDCRTFVQFLAEINLWRLCWSNCGNFFSACLTVFHYYWNVLLVHPMSNIKGNKKLPLMLYIIFSYVCIIAPSTVRASKHINTLSGWDAYVPSWRRGMHSETPCYKKVAQSPKFNFFPFSWTWDTAFKKWPHNLHPVHLFSIIVFHYWYTVFLYYS